MSDRMGIALLVAMLFAASCAAEEDGLPWLPEGEGCAPCRVRGVTLELPARAHPYVGDLWPMARAPDGSLYAAFGDGTGMANCLPTLLPGEEDEFDAAYIEERPGCYRPRETANEYCEVFACTRCLPQCLYTPAGLLRLSGRLPDLAPCGGVDQCVVARHIPYGDLRIYDHGDKPSSLVFVGDRLYAHMHHPPGAPLRGYLARSADRGRSWEMRPDSPWGPQSNFRVMMFLQGGPGDAPRHLYAFGIGEEVGADFRVQRVHLARVRLARDGGADPILDYRAWRYFAGLDARGRPRWTEDEGQAQPLSGLFTIAQGSALYHPALDRYLFLTGFAGVLPGRRLGFDFDDPYPAGVLFEAEAPWGPWSQVGAFPGGYVATLIPKDLSPDGVWIAAAGAGPFTYNLNIARLRLERRARR